MSGSGELYEVDVTVKATAQRMGIDCAIKSGATDHVSKSSVGRWTMMKEWTWTSQCARRHSGLVDPGECVAGRCRIQGRYIHAHLEKCRFVR